MLEGEDMSLKSCCFFSPISLVQDTLPMASPLHPSTSPCPQSPPWGQPAPRAAPLLSPLFLRRAEKQSFA